jgi:hypothetical protein
MIEPKLTWSEIVLASLVTVILSALAGLGS